MTRLLVLLLMVVGFAIPASTQTTQLRRYAPCYEVAEGTPDERAACDLGGNPPSVLSFSKASGLGYYHTTQLVKGTWTGIVLRDETTRSERNRYTYEADLADGRKLFAIFHYNWGNSRPNSVGWHLIMDSAEVSQ